MDDSMTLDMYRDSWDAFLEAHHDKIKELEKLDHLAHQYVSKQITAIEFKKKYKELKNG